MQGKLHQLQCSPGPISLFRLTLTHDIHASALVNPHKGQLLIFVIDQDEKGGHVFGWPLELKGLLEMNLTPRAVTTRAFIWDGEAGWPL